MSRPHEKEESMEPGTLHVISEIGGCIVGLPPDEKEITDSLRNYARREGLESLELVDPASQGLGWLGRNGECRRQGIQSRGTCSGGNA